MAVGGQEGVALLRAVKAVSRVFVGGSMRASSLQLLPEIDKPHFAKRAEASTLAECAGHAILANTRSVRLSAHQFALGLPGHLR